MFKNTVLLVLVLMVSCGKVNKREVGSGKQEVRSTKLEDKDKKIIVAANRTQAYLPLLRGKNVAVVANQTSVVFRDEKLEIRDERLEDRKENIEEIEKRKAKKTFVHLVDSLLKLNVDIKKVFAPEHGFRGTADAGELIKDGIDVKSGLPIVSLYGSNKKPTAIQLQNIDVLVFDIQDVGARFYTYISTLHYVMEACAENNIPVLILDRPNPNGHYVDGPILEKAHQSFVGMHPIPVVHGMTIGEYAKMINAEGWLNNGIKCDLTVISIENYTHKTPYSLPIKPSPNLPNDVAINLYPSLCFFEGTPLSVGRGTDKQFQVIGMPKHIIADANFEFIPKPNTGAKHPKHKGKTCYGYNLSNVERLNEINLKWLIDFYNFRKEKSVETSFFKPFFTKLAGTKKLQQQIEAGLSQAQIKATWQEDLNNFKLTRKKYLLYQD